jgi:hypothetical protein
LDGCWDGCIGHFDGVPEFLRLLGPDRAEPESVDTIVKRTLI